MPFVIALNLSEKPRFVIFPKDGFDISLVHFMSTESYFFWYSLFHTILIVYSYQNHLPLT